MEYRVNKRVIIIDLKDDRGRYLLVNSLNGLADIIHKEQYTMLMRWKEEREIVVETSQEQLFFEELKQRQYILDEVEERVLEDKLLTRLKQQYNDRVADCRCAVFVLTYGCNFMCPYCYENRACDTKVMTPEMVDTVFSLHNDKLEHIQLFGGEPLLPQNRRIIEYIVNKAPEAQYSIITNGYYVDKYLELLKSVRVSNVQITIDGTQKTHDATRILKNGQGTYEKILANIELLVHNNLPVTVRMNVSKDNIEEIYTEIDCIKEYEWGKNVKFEMQPLFQMDTKEKNVIYEEFLKREKEGYRNEILNNLSIIADFLYNDKRMYPVLKTCDRETTGRYYDANGDMYSCILAVGNSEKAIGKYYPALQMKEKSFATRDITTIEACKKCSNAFLCGGGCPNALPENLDLYSPNCTNFFENSECIIPYVYYLKHREKENCTE